MSEEIVAASRLHDAVEAALRATEAAEEAVMAAIGRVEFIRRGRHGQPLSDEALDHVKARLVDHGTSLAAIADGLSELVDEGPST